MLHLCTKMPLYLYKTEAKLLTVWTINRISYPNNSVVAFTMTLNYLNFKEKLFLNVTYLTKNATFGHSYC